MSKQLFVALTAEGITDEVFLGTIVRRILEEISRKNNSIFSVGSIIWLGPSKSEKTLAKALDAYNLVGSQILIIHRDTDQHSRELTLEHHISPLLAQLPEDMLTEMPVVPLIIKHEQETWFFADLDVLDNILEGNLDRRSLNLPPDIEKRANTKELFEKLLRDVNKKQSRKRGYQYDNIVERLANEISLTQLARLSSCKEFISDLEAALRKINYLPPIKTP